jgi:hypothetical protein
LLCLGILVCFMMADGAAGPGPECTVVSGNMPGNTSDRCTF